jgi:AcrR family transcriptional regulator
VGRPSLPRSPRTSGSRPKKPPAPPRIDIAGIRREQIVEAAASIITTQGIQNLSLSEIEAHTGMSRGQLTYYFKTKEDILLAVFDRMVRRMREGFDSPKNRCRQLAAQGDVWLKMQGIMAMALSHAVQSDFAELQYTFLAQIGHRDDFRQRLASLYEEWRSHTAEGLAKMSPPPPADTRTVSSLFQAIVHGLVMQLQADPNAFDRTAMYELCLDVLGRYLQRPGGSRLTSPHTRAPNAPSPEGPHDD